LTRVLWQKKDLDTQSDDADQRHTAGR
jgi:hypothetical protein